jgi:hypothetical protein
MYDESSTEHPYRLPYTMNFKPSEDAQTEEGVFSFTANESLYNGETYSLAGTSRPSEGDKLLLAWCIKSPSYADEYFSCVFNTATNTISGTAGYDPDARNHTDTVFLSQQPPEVLACRPHPAVLAVNRPASLWAFARDAILLQVRRKLWSWSYFRDRRVARKRYLELAIRYDHFNKPLSDEEYREFLKVKRRFSPGDSWFLVSIAIQAGESRIHV